MKNNDVIYSICTTNQFRKDLKLMEKRGYNIALLDEIVDLLSKSYLLKIETMF